MKILVLGAGATGGYFGGRLAEAGLDVHFLVRPRRQAQLKGDGLRVESPLGAIHRAVATLTRDQLDDSFDLVILACKAWDLGAAIEAITPAMRGQARILPLLNGLAHLGALVAVFGGEAVLGGLCQIAATLTPEGTIRHLNPFSALIFGPRQDSQRPLCEALAPWFPSAARTFGRSSPGIASWPPRRPATLGEWPGLGVDCLRFDGRGADPAQENPRCSC